MVKLLDEVLVMGYILQSIILKMFIYGRSMREQKRKGRERDELYGQAGRSASDYDVCRKKYRLCVQCERGNDVGNGRSERKDGELYL